MPVKCRMCGGVRGIPFKDFFKCQDCTVLVADMDVFFGKPDIVVPPIPPPPPPIIPPDVEYMDKPAKKAGFPTRYGFDDKTFSGGSTRTYILPIGRLYPGNRNQVKIDVYNLGVPAGGDIDLKLTSPEGYVATSASPTTSDECIDVRAQGAQQPNYPCPFLNKGDWLLEITAKENSRVRIWWYSPY